jgi:hypothetical protein
LDTNTITKSECAGAVDVPSDDPGGDDGDTGGGDDGDTGGGDDTDGDDGDTGGDDTGGGNTTSVSTGGGNTTGGGSEGGRNPQNDQSGASAGQRALPVTGLGIGVLALLGAIMLLLGAGLRTKMSTSKV